MSKVYSFRLSDDNPREAQAREVIEAWVKEGFSLRQIIITVLLDQNISTNAYGELKAAIDDLRALLNSQSLNSQLLNDESTTSLPESFLEGIQKSMRPGLID